jgi:DNA helicase-2/ATP-dependent DNA helicase PcrA
VADQSELASRVDGFVVEARELDMAEERRLAYVATTRARAELLCHGYRWGSGRRPLNPSPFLLEVAARPGVAVDVWTDDPGDMPMAGADAPSWPTDPLGRHRAALESGAALVRDALAKEPDSPAEASDPPVNGGTAATWRRDVELLLAERSAERDRGTRVTLPTHLSATQLVAIRRDPEEFLQRLRRPMPIRPRVEARQGTAFHAWVEQRYGNPRLLDLDELPGAADALDPPATADLAALQEAFLASEWADRTPVEIEAPFEMVLDGLVVRGRVDAVFADGDGLLVVDWKTGPPPTAPAEIAARAAQLAAYREAFAALHDLPLQRVRAVFHHVREGATIEGDLTSDERVPAIVADVAARASR